jgi:predicted PurR-regulated permease PerM
MDAQINNLEKKEKDIPFDHILISKDRSFSLYFRLAGAIIAYLGYLTFQSLSIVYMILTGFIISIAVESIIVIFERLRIGRMTSIGITYLLFMLFLLSGFLFIIPFVSDQIGVVIQKLTLLVQLLLQQVQLYGAKELLMSR